MSRNTPSLAELQDMFQRAVLSGDSAALLALVPDNGRTTREALLGVYRGAYIARLIEVIGNDHALLKAYIGDAAFQTMARAYIGAHPSSTPNARWFADALPRFLAASPSFASAPQLAELALLERALEDAFDSADAPVLALADLTALAPDDWGTLVFEGHPGARRLDLSTNAFAIWTALKAEEAAPAAAILLEPQRLLVWRQNMTARVREIGAEEAMMWDEAAKGVPFGRLCELIAVFDDPGTAALRAAQYLHGWITSGALSGGRPG
jgi:hypothetical protein